MWAILGKMILMALAEDSVKRVIKSVIKEKVTKKTKTDFDDELVDVIFDSKSRSELSRNVINYGADKLLDSLDDGINSTDINNFLTKAEQSKHNNTTIPKKNKMMSYV